MDQLEGQLKGFEEVNEEQISIQKESLQLENQKLDSVKIQFKQIGEKYQQLKNLKEDFELYKEEKRRF